MRRLLLGTILCACAAVVADNVTSTNGVRNPFWPMGYEGVRETISPNVRPKPKPAPAKAKPAAAKSATPLTLRLAANGKFPGLYM